MEKSKKHGIANAQLGERLLGKARHANALFHGINDLQKQGLFCDTVGDSGNPTHKIVLMGVKEAGFSNLKKFRKSLSMSSDGQEHCDESDDDMDYSECYDDSAFVSQEDKIVSENHERCLYALNNLRLQKQVCDVTLKINGEEILAHKLILAATSNYFRCMFQDNLKEKHMNVILLDKLNECVDPTYFREVLNYIYTGEIALEYSNAFEIMCMAVYLQIKTLVNHCQNYLISQVCLDTCCELAYLSSIQCLDELKQVTSNFIHDHFCELNGAESHLELVDREEVLKCLRSSTLGGNKSSSSDETSILKNVLTWMAINKAYKATELLLNVRLPLISKAVITENCAKTPLCNKQEWENALTYHDKIFEQPLLQTPNSQLRTTIFNWVCIDGVLAPSTLKLPHTSPYIESYGECRQNKFKINNKFQNIRDPFHSVLEFNGFIYVLGGTRYTSEGYSNEVIRYDPRMDQSITVASMNEKRGDFYCCVKDNHIYVFGGRNKTGAITTCERYDPKTNSWEFIEDLPNGPRYMMAGEVSNNSIVISGGFNDDEAVGTIHKLNCDTMEWEQLFCQLWCERGYHVMVKAQDGKLYIIGGVDNPFAGRNVWEVEVFDPETEDIELVGQVLPIQPFLSVQRLNALVDESGDICIFAVTNTDHSFIKFSMEKNLWEAINFPINLFEILVNVNGG